MKLNLKMITDLNVSTKTMKFLIKNIGVNFCDLKLGNGYLDTKAQAT